MTSSEGTNPYGSILKRDIPIYGFLFKTHLRPFIIFYLLSTLESNLTAYSHATVTLLSSLLSLTFCHCSNAYSVLPKAAYNLGIKVGCSLSLLDLNSCSNSSNKNLQ